MDATIKPVQNGRGRKRRWLADEAAPGYYPARRNGTIVNRFLRCFERPAHEAFDDLL